MNRGWVGILLVVLSFILTVVNMCAVCKYSCYFFGFGSYDISFIDCIQPSQDRYRYIPVEIRNGIARKSTRSI